MSVIISYRLLRVLRILARSRERFLVFFFLLAWLTSTLLFYWSEHIVAGRSDVDIWTSMYWSLITMATVGYGDVVPSRGVGWAVAAMAAIFGIAVYTLFISTLADRFLEATVKASMGLGRLHGKRIIVIGEGAICEEAINELVANNLKDETGWIRESNPKGEPPVEFIVGDLSENTLRRGGVSEAEKVIICYEDDSKAIHATALVRKINPSARIIVLAKDKNTVSILEMLGATLIIPIAVIGRLLASGGFEPSVVRFISDVTTARTGLDLRERELSAPTSIERIEQEEGIRIVAVEREGELLPAAMVEGLKPGDKIIYVKRVSQGERK